MKYNYILPIIIATVVFFAGCELSNSAKMEQPVAKKIPKKLVANGDTRIDNYYWLNERENPEVIAYLNDENAYTKAMMQSTEQLQKDIYNEIVGRIKQTDESVPYTYNGYTYYTRYEDFIKDFHAEIKKIDKKFGLNPDYRKWTEIPKKLDDRNRKFQIEFSDEERQLVAEKCAQIMKQLGYR